MTNLKWKTARLSPEGLSLWMNTSTRPPAPGASVWSLMVTMGVARAVAVVVEVDLVIAVPGSGVRVAPQAAAAEIQFHRLALRGDVAGEGDVSQVGGPVEPVMNQADLREVRRIQGLVKVDINVADE